MIFLTSCQINEDLESQEITNYKKKCPSCHSCFKKLNLAVAVAVKIYAKADGKVF